jgi:hypothetical protein
MAKIRLIDLQQQNLRVFNKNSVCWSNPWLVCGSLPSMVHATIRHWDPKIQGSLKSVSISIIIGIIGCLCFIIVIIGCVSLINVNIGCLF